MSLQFRLGYNDQKVVEDFVSRQPVATSAIVLDPKAGTRQRHAAEAAASARVDVFWDPATELLSYEGSSSTSSRCGTANDTTSTSWLRHFRRAALSLSEPSQHILTA